MPMYQSDRRPEITSDELPNIVRLLAVFDRITFNGHGEILALLDVTLPVLGKVTISLWDREEHINVRYPGDDGGMIWNGYLHKLIENYSHEGLSRDVLVAGVRNAIKEEIIKQMA